MIVLEVIFPVFAVALAGYAAAYKRVLSAGDIAGISRFVFTVAIPVLLFNSLAHLELPARINWQFLLSYYVVALFVYGLGVWMSRRWFAHSPQEQGVFGLGASYSNMLLVGLPIISAGLGDEALLPLFMLVSIHSATLFLMVTLLAERGNGPGRSSRQLAAQTIKNLTRNPIIASLALGLLANVLAVPIPKVVDDTLTVLSQATLPCALFVLGASLNAYQVAGHFTEAWTIIGLKLALQPFLVWLLVFIVFHIDPLWGAVAVMVAGMPVGINAYLFAQKYQAGIAAVSTAILLSTLLAVFSQSLLLAIFISVL
ncbi:MAG: AEC family transporter [Chloroflexi bacterium]|nr:AEC family transporter [Chloroflexota bacterium]MCI0648144.1 AEC family transporter [Chloroflexota bacterium]MCI0726659.1 AEC family transporter [Chloroflexota bacterium]